MTEDLMAAMTHRVMDEGYFVQHVSEEQSALGRYSYTVGRALFDRPEFLVTGMPPMFSTYLLDALAEMDHTRGRGRSTSELIGEQWCPVIQGEPIEVRLLLATPIAAIGALAGLGHRTEVLQAVWGRGDGTFPTVEARWRDQPLFPLGSNPFTQIDPYA